MKTIIGFGFAAICGVCALYAAPFQAAGVYDLVIANGRVIDPESGLDGVRHIGIVSGVVRAVAPGFIDLHQDAQRAVNPAVDALRAVDGVAPGRAVRAPTRGEETIQGRWKLIAAEDLRADGSVARYPWGSRPVGSIVVEGGSCYLQIMSGDVPSFGSGAQPAGEQMKAALLSSYIAYSGPCTIDDAAGSVTLKVEAAWRPDYVGTEQKRFFRFDNGKLIFGPAPNSVRGTGEALTRRLTLERQP
ncbi:MAG: hypothetical protein DMG03_00390 [Acidobacteria bacterium]|nr:MAG: hypothetical protein DMG03_00390 [Acidobacteriota bacterium]